MKPICWACSAPLQNAPFSPSIKLNDIFPLGALDAVSRTSGDAGRPRCHKCVLSKEGGLRKSGSKHRGVRIWSPPPHRFTEETAASGKKKREKNRQGSSQRDIRFETWVFCVHMNSQAPSDRWGMEISHYERQISLLFWFCGGHKAKCGISEIILKRNYTLKNSSPVWLAEGRWMG